VRFGIRGATLVAFAFIIPSFIMVIALAWLYLRFGGLSWMQGAFYGIGAAVIAIIARSAWKLTRTSLGTDYLLWVLFVFSALVTAWTESEIVWLFLLSGIVVMAVRARRAIAAPAVLVLPPWLFSGLRGPANDQTLSRLFWYFA
jgi:chromate transporter